MQVKKRLEESPIEASTPHAPHFIFIAAESLEQAFFDETLFPNLLPHLKKIEQQSIRFTNIQQIGATSWSIAGMVAMLCGVPISMPGHYLSDASLASLKPFYPKAQCLSDVLAESAHYSLAFYQGISLDFAGMGAFVETHSFDTIQGLEGLLPLKPEQKTHAWGLYDEALFEFALYEFLKNTDTHKKERFGLFVLTMDTHPPKGLINTFCKNHEYQGAPNAQINRSLLNAIHCADFIISTFIKNIHRSKVGKNTPIFLVSDHLLMGHEPQQQFENVSRKNLFMIIPPPALAPEAKEVTKPGTPLDVGTTVLQYLGFSGKIGLGENLLSPQPTLAETHPDVSGFLAQNQAVFEELWDLPNIKNDIKIDLDEKEIHMGETRFEFPALLKFKKESFAVVPYFDDEEYFYQRINRSLIQFDPEELLVWVDSCQKTSLLKKLPWYRAILKKIGGSDYCYAVGQLGGELLVGNVKKQVLVSQSDTQKILKSPFDEKLAQQRKKNLQFAVVNPLFPLENIPQGSRIYLPKEYLEKRPYRGFKSELKNFLIEEGYQPTMELSMDEVTYVSFYGVDVKKFQHLFEIQNENNVFKFSPRQKQWNRSEAQIQKEMKEPQRFIAHAGGAIDGFLYTNSLEALDLHYQKGFKLFELDIIKTSDGAFVAAHDWKHWKQITGYEGVLPPTRQVFLQHKIRGKYTPLAIEEINQWFLQHSDAILVTDKLDEPLAFSKKFIDPKRLIMELFSWEALEAAQKISPDLPMASWSLVNDLPGDKLETLKARNIKRMAAPRQALAENGELFIKMKQAGIKIFLFNFNWENPFDEVFGVCHELEDYAYGIYADYWNFTETVQECHKPLRP